VLVKQHGTTEFPWAPIPPVKILEQRTTNITVALNQAWLGTADKYFYNYRYNAFSDKCVDKDDQQPGEKIAEVTIQCDCLKPQAHIEICLQDDTGNLLTATDDGTVPKCCPGQIEEARTVCYAVLLQCVSKCDAESATSRMLRGVSGA